MKNTATATRTGVRPEKTGIPAETIATRKKIRAWTPQSPGISREDMRQIVIEMIG